MRVALDRRDCLSLIAVAVAAGAVASPTDARMHDEALWLIDPSLANVGEGAGRVVHLRGDRMRIWRNVIAGQATQLRGLTRWSDFMLLRELARDDGMRICSERFQRTAKGGLTVLWSADVR